MTSKQIKKAMVSSLFDSQDFLTKAVPLFFAETFTRRQRGIGALGVVGIVAASTAVGAGIALFLAPTTGSELRDRVLESLKSMKETAESKGQKAADELKGAKNEAAARIENGTTTQWSAS